MKKTTLLAVALTMLSAPVYAKEILRIFAWEGYVTPADLISVNTLLEEQGYDIEAKLIEPFASGPEQMFNIIRGRQCDVSFLTLNYINMQGEKTSKLLQAIDSKSPRMPNYAKLIKGLTNIPMGMSAQGPLYIPWGGGAYGIWANMKKLSDADLPLSVKDLWRDKWKGKLSLSKGQIQPNIAIVMLAVGKPPYHINNLLTAGNRAEAIDFVNKEAQEKTNLLYKQVKHFWDGVPDYSDDLLLTASYGVEIAAENAKGGRWQYVQFKEGSTVWMDTINFTKDLTGKKLEAAEIFANYFIGKEVQTRVVNDLSMVSVSTLVEKNPLLDSNADFFSAQMFWPPYDKIADNIMKGMSDTAMAAAKK